MSGLKLSDTQVCEPYIRARLGTAAHVAPTIGGRLVLPFFGVRGLTEIYSNNTLAVLCPGSLFASFFLVHQIGTNPANRRPILATDALFCQLAPYPAN